MLDWFASIATIFAAREVIKERCEPVAPKGTRFDWEAYWADVDRGMSAMEQVKKRQSGGYTTTKPIQKPTEVIPQVVDIKRYEHDKKLYGEAITEVNRKCGMYMFVK